jgi:hypothetical protein
MVGIWNSAKRGKSTHSLCILLHLNHANRTGNRWHPALQLVAEGYEWKRRERRRYSRSGEAGGVRCPGEQQTPPSHLSISPPTSTLQVTVVREAYDPQDPTPPPATHLQPETEPQQLSFKILAPTPVPCRFFKRTTPAPLLPHAHHPMPPMSSLPLPLLTARPKSSPSGSISRFWPRPPSSPRIFTCATPAPLLPHAHQCSPLRP